MSPRRSVPATKEPSHEARLLFLRLLNAEWPALQESLLAQVLPALQRVLAGSSGDSMAARGFVRKGGFEAPVTILRWSNLRRSPRYVDLHRALCKWASESGRGLQRDWILDSALATLEQDFPDGHNPYDSEVLAQAKATGDANLVRLITNPAKGALPWRYGHHRYGKRWGAPFELKFLGTLAHPEEAARWLPGHDRYFGTKEQFQKRMRNQFERELSQYCREITRHWSLNKGRRHIDYARWTIARLSGLTLATSGFALPRASALHRTRHSGEKASQGIPGGTRSDLDEFCSAYRLSV